MFVTPMVRESKVSTIINWGEFKEANNFCKVDEKLYAYHTPA